MVITSGLTVQNLQNLELGVPLVDRAELPHKGPFAYCGVLATAFLCFLSSGALQTARTLERIVFGNPLPDPNIDANARGQATVSYLKTVAQLQHWVNMINVATDGE
jgi:hypothetical protein